MEKDGPSMQIGHETQMEDQLEQLLLLPFCGTMSESGLEKAITPWAPMHPPARILTLERRSLPWQHLVETERTFNHIPLSWWQNFFLL